MNNPPVFSTFLPVAGDATNHKFLLDIDGIEYDWGQDPDDSDTILFPTGTPQRVIKEFIQSFLIRELGKFSFEVVVCQEDRSVIYANIDPPFSLENRSMVEKLIADLANSVRRV